MGFKLINIILEGACCWIQDIVYKVLTSFLCLELDSYIAFLFDMWPVGVILQGNILIKIW